MRRRVFVALLALTVAVDLAIFVIRVAAAYRFSDLIPVPIEGPGIYAIWKIQHGYPMAELPTRPFFGLTLYNVFFYQTYARLLTLLHVADAALPTGAHLLTPAFALAGACAQYAAMRALLQRLDTRSSPWLLAAASLMMWIGVGLVGRWALAARPDVPAVAVAVAALAIVLASADPSLRRLASASVVFFVAWGFKQSVVGIFGGVCLYELFFCRSPRKFAALVLPFSALCALTIAMSGAAYRFNLLTAPRISGASVPWLAVYWYRVLVLPNLPIWIAAAAGLWHWLDRRDAADARWRNPSLALLVCATLTTIPLAFVLLAKPGSHINHTFESCAVLVLLAIASFSMLVDRPPASNRCVYGIAAAAMVFPLAYAVFMLNGGPPAALRALTLAKDVDPLTPGTASQHAARAALVDRMRELPKPLFIDDELLAQPWFSNDNRYPAIVIDHVFYGAADAGGYLERGGVLSLVDDRYFATLLLSPPPYYLWRRHAVASGYVPVGTIARDEGDLTIYVRSETAPRKALQSRRPTSRKTP